MTHLIVFIVQAAVPIVMILVGQYVVAQRLAWLARQGGLSRQGSLRQQQQESGSYASSSSKSPSNNDHHHHQTSYMAGSAARPTLARLDVPSPQSVRRDLPPLLRLPGGGASATDPTHFARREQQRRRRLATSSGIPERVPAAAAATSTTRMTSVAATMAEVTSQSHHHLHLQQDIVTVPRVMTPSHRHNRSASQPVNLTELAAKATFPESVSGTHNSNDNNNGSGLGVTFDDDESHHPYAKTHT